MALEQQRSVTTKGQMDVLGLDCCPGSCLWLRAVQDCPIPHLGIVGELALGAGEMTPPLA